jgi:hypothetical protein
MERRIRAVGPRGVIFISEATARNAKFLAKYGIMVDDEKFGKAELSPTKIGKVVIAAEPIEIAEPPKKKFPKVQPKQD